MISPHLLELELPHGTIPAPSADIDSAETTDARQWENTQLRWQRGDMSRSDTPIAVWSEIPPGGFLSQKKQL